MELNAATGRGEDPTAIAKNTAASRPEARDHRAATGPPRSSWDRREGQHGRSPSVGDHAAPLPLPRQYMEEVAPPRSSLRSTWARSGEFVPAALAPGGDGASSDSLPRAGEMIGSAAECVWGKGGDTACDESVPRQAMAYTGHDFRDPVATKSAGVVAIANRCRRRRGDGLLKLMMVNTGAADGVCLPLAGVWTTLRIAKFKRALTTRYA